MESKGLTLCVVGGVVCRLLLFHPASSNFVPLVSVGPVFMDSELSTNCLLRATCKSSKPAAVAGRLFPEAVPEEYSSSSPSQPSQPAQDEQAADEDAAAAPRGYEPKEEDLTSLQLMKRSLVRAPRGIGPHTRVVRWL